MSLVLQAFVISQPQDWLVGDELYFSWATRLLLDGVDRTPYNLPGLHVIGAVAISIFRDTWFSLRVPVVIFSMLTLLVFYNVCIKFTSKQNALLATTILSFDTVFFLYSHLYLRDVPLMFFGMMSLYLYLNKRYYLAALTLGIGAFFKETILFFFILIVIYHIGTNFERFKEIFRIKSSPLIQHKTSVIELASAKKTTIFLIILSSSFLLPLWAYDIVVTPAVYEPMIPVRKLPDGTEVEMPLQLILVYESRGYNVQNQIGVITNPVQHLETYFTKGYLSGAYDASKHKVTQSFFPQNWVLPLPPNMEERLGVGLGWKKADPFDEIRNGLPYKGEILGVERLAFANIALWPIAFWGSLALTVYSVIKKQNNKSVLFIAAGIASMYIPYILIHVFNGRVVFPYYFIYTIPFISLGIILLFDKIKNDKIRFLVKILLLAAIVSWFVWLFPVKILGEVMIPI